jgi:cellulose synthase/poly-beta-1,6-N-acetylglucosamine synthase-like glycosyltransferase
MISLPFIFFVGIAGLVNLLIWRLDRHRALNLKAGSTDQFSLPSVLPAVRVSFLIAAWNERTNVGRCLESILALPYPDMEIVLCTGGQDGTYAIADTTVSRLLDAKNLRARAIVLEQKPGEGKQRALQRCLEAATGELIYLTDADCLIQEQAFARCIVPLLQQSEKVVTGSFYLPLPDQERNPFVQIQASGRAYSATQRWCASQPLYRAGLQGANCAMRRNTLMEAGEFKNIVFTGTDYDLAKRLLERGSRIYYDPLSSIRSEFPTNLSVYYRQQTRWIRNVLLIGMQYRAYGEVAANLRTAMLGLGMLGMPFVSLLLGLAGMRWNVVFSTAAFLTWIALGLILIWSGLFAYAFFSRLRYLAFARIWCGVLNRPSFQYTFRTYLLIPILMLVDYVAWSLPVLEYPVKSLRQRW